MKTDDELMSELDPPNMKSAYFGVKKENRVDEDETKVLQSNINPNVLYPFL